MSALASFQYTTTTNYTIDRTLLSFVKIFKILKCAKTVTLSKVRVALKASWQVLLNGVKQKICTVLVKCVIKA